MISDSVPWKQECLKIAGKLAKRYNQKKWSDRSLFTLEKEVFLGLFALRKLMESNKVSDAVKNREVQLAIYPANEKPITLLNQHKFPELYDLYAGQKEAVKYWDLCNQFIHSSIFAPFVPTGSSLVGFYIASDWAKKKKLYYVQLKVLVEMLESVGNDYPQHIELVFNHKVKEYKFSSF
ncbi:MAG: hypothetical protein WC024_20980 [Shewanella sp.]|uniref:hypothetical protein n=1 Tax=unclassified Shewanella TaxID=196818 RepID=UPI0021DA1DA3|nr:MULTISPECIES: hypothetical protein [unclassified Shewanella]MCU8021543.1 hypothetical protein [Shewanella sp. SM78]MCU8036871.1 hypothetical protein [Shewanella sp. SM71]MCU8078740.1 hypothetical protein [Shewanella sp. SM103]MCU8098761.1 hypothetical protein [Shewanella sp. SM102]